MIKEIFYSAFLVLSIAVTCVANAECRLATEILKYDGLEESWSLWVYFVNDSEETVTVSLGRNQNWDDLSWPKSNGEHAIFVDLRTCEIVSIDGVKYALSEGSTSVNKSAIAPHCAALLRKFIVPKSQGIRSLSYYYDVDEEYGKMHDVWAGKLSCDVKFISTDPKGD